MAMLWKWRFAPTGPELLESRDVPAASYDTLPVVPTIDGPMQARLQDVAERGRQLGNSENVLAKAGDSITAQGSNFLTPLGQLGYNAAAAGLPGELYGTWAAYLTPTAGGSSYTRVSASAYPGWQSGNVVGTAATEISITRAGIALIMIGTNDWPHSNTDLYRANLRQIVTTYLSLGVVPVLSTIPDSYYTATTAAWVPRANQVIADVADEFDIPVWNYWRALQTLPGHGIGDGIHPNTSPNGGGDFSAVGLLYGYNVRNFTALQVLSKVRSVVFDDAVPDGYSVPAATVWRPLADGQPLAVTGAGRGEAGVVTISDAVTGKLIARFLPYGDFRGGVSVAVGDVNGDGVPDVVTGAGRGGGPVVKAFSGTDGRELFSIFAFEPGFSGGVSVAAGDLDGDGKAEIVVGAGPGGGPRVRVFQGGTRAVVRDFYAFESTFSGGVNVAVGDFGPGFGTAIVATPGAGGGSVVKLFDAAGGLLRSAEVFESTYREGLSVALTDGNGDGFADLVVGAVVGSTRVRAVTVRGGELASFFAGPPQSFAGVRLGVVVGRSARAVGETRDGTNVYNILDPLDDVIPLHGAPA